MSVSAVKGTIDAEQRESGERLLFWRVCVVTRPAERRGETRAINREREREKEKEGGRERGNRISAREQRVSDFFSSVSTASLTP